jgi:AcrR family transcriptional regulator
MDDIVMDAVTEKPRSKGAETRRKIVFAAAKVLSEKGYSETKLDDIAVEAGTKAGSLYYHFASREEIIREVLLASMETISEEVEAALAELPKDSSFAEQMRSGITAHLKAILSERPFMAAYNRIINEIPDSIRKEFLSAPRRYGQRWQELIVRAQKRGELRKDLDPSLFRLLLFGSVTWTQLWFKPSGRVSVDKLANHVVEIFLWGAHEFEPDHD